ncbi:hypothetical protein [Methanosphaera sp.]
MKMEIEIDPELQRRARAVCRNISGLTLAHYYEWLIEMKLRELPSVDEISDDRPHMDSYNPEELDDLW